MRQTIIASALLCAGLIAVPAHAQLKPLPYGNPVSLAQAQTITAAALAQSAKMGLAESVAIVEPNGQLVSYVKMDGTQYGSTLVAMNKAISAAEFRRPTKVFRDLIAKGPEFNYLLQLGAANSVPGGLLIVSGGKIVGGLGCSGGTGDEDIQVCQAGLDALK
jgi:glc operon protein GlcG